MVSERSGLRIVYLTAGAATRYCGSCLHDNGLARALTALGEDIRLVPLYTPLRTDEQNVSLKRVFFGGVNVYLQQHSAVFRHTPWFVDRLLDSPPLLEWLARRSAGMNPARLGDLTVSTLEGQRGRQRKEIDKLLRWLEREAKPDIVHISNALLLGIAPALRERLGVPIVCSLAGEDLFLEQLPEPHYSRSRELLSERVKDVDHFVAYSRYFAQFMTDYLGLDPTRVAVIRHGLNLDGQPVRPRRDRRDAPFTIGCFGRVAPEKGVHLLVEAFARLSADSALPQLRLRIAGYKSSGDEPYFSSILERVRQLGLADRVTYEGELDRSAKVVFLQSLDVMSVPSVYRESKGMSVLEALAAGVPVVVPRHGAFPEMMEHTSGGLLCNPNDPADLAAKLREMILNPPLVEQCGRRASEAIRAHYTAEQMARQHRELYSRILGIKPSC